MELRQLRTFNAVTRHGTVTAAANALGVAPSSVSEQIRVLERSLDIALFERGPRGMRLTRAGERMLEWAQRLLDMADQARREVTGTRPALRLGAVETIAGMYVPGVLARLAERHPDLRVDVRTDAARDELLAAVASRELDAALILDTGGAIGELGFALPPVPLDFVDVEPVPLALVSAPTHRLRERPHLTRADLRGERLLVNVSACAFWMAGERLLGSGVERVRVGGVSVMRAWAAQGLGIALLPEFAVADDLAEGSLVRLGLPTSDLSLRLVWRSDGDTRPDLRALLYATVAR